MLSFIALCVLMGIGYYLRLKIKLFQKLYLPSCVIAGLLGLIIIQAVSLTAAHTEIGALDALNKNILQWTSPWAKLPGFLINIVFACLFLGVQIPGFSQLWKRAAPQLAYGQIVAWGQYVTAIAAFLILIHFIAPDLPDMFAGILPVGFEGGHGTAAGMGPVFEEKGFPAGKDLALTSATAGILSAILVGMILVNWASRKGYTVKKANPANILEDDSIGPIPVDHRPAAGRLTVKSDAIETLSLHIAIVGLAMLIGYIIKQSLVGLESLWPAMSDMGLLRAFPLFPLCMIGGLIIQLLSEKFDPHKVIDVGITKRIQNSSLDFLVVAAIATIKVKAVAAALIPLAILVCVGILWNVFCVTVIARRFFKNAWFERAIAEMGQSMGVTATGLLLLRVVDPDYETPAVDAFASKQLLHEPFMGGGLWTGMAIPLLATIGAWPVLGIAVTAMIIWSVISLIMVAKSQ